MEISMKPRILLNGVGRIGKAIVRLAQATDAFEITTINEINPSIESIAYTINYDSTYGALGDKYTVHGNTLRNSRHTIRVLNHPSLNKADLEEIDLIIDASGAKVDRDRYKQLDIKALFLTHPNAQADINVILGVNDADLDPRRHTLISTSSCNATALLPLLKLIDEHNPILYGDILTVHPLLSHQKVLDNGCVGSADRGVACNMEFGRSATQNIIPSRTTTIEACSYVLPSFNAQRFASSSLRVPTPTVGAINVTLTLEHTVTREAILEWCQSYAQTQTHDILLNNHAPLVSSDFQQEHFTTIVDHRFTDVKMDKMVKLLVWYDNEWGYASKVVDIVKEYIRKS
jgi:glyceraldehyde 3-phosphate dehydrogenase